ncbi:MAG: AIR synthase family protein [Chloroflexota bacterium]
MSIPLHPPGKISAEVFDRIIFRSLGAASEKMIVAPQHGVDVGVVRLDARTVMALTTDPIFVVPEYGWERAAWFAVHILASDAATSGLRPTYATFDLNLPRSISDQDLETLWTAIHRTCEDLAITIVAGHTGRYDGCAYPMVGGATVMAIGGTDEWVTPTMARVGDAVILTKGPAIEATGLFAATFPRRIERRYGIERARAAEEVFHQMSVVRDAMTAVSVGVRENGVTAMHDATECGVWGGLVEVAQASGVGLRIDRDAIHIPEAVRLVCDEFAIDPFTSISEGALIMTVRPAKADAVVTALHADGIASDIIGEVVPAERGLRYATNGQEFPLNHPRIDPFWTAFARALEAEPSG